MADESAVDVDVFAQRGCDDETLLAFLDELRQRAGQVRIERHPYAHGGPTEVYFLITILTVAGSFYLKSFVETLGAEHAKTLNRKLLDVLRSNEGGEHYRGMYPLRIGGNGVWFHICRPCAADELTARFRMAAEVADREMTVAIVDESRDELLFYWNLDRSAWEEMPVGEYGPELPDSAG